MSTQIKQVLRVVTIGHLDHGKTTLATAMSRYSHWMWGLPYIVDYDVLNNAPEERINGVSVNVAYSEYVTQHRKYLLIDCPKHDDYITILSPESDNIDGAILVVSAIDGPMSETLEQIALCRKKGIPNIICFLNKCDMITDQDDGLIELIEMDISNSLYENGYMDSPIICGSALDADSYAAYDDFDSPILLLMKEIDNLLPSYGV